MLERLREFLSTCVEVWTLVGATWHWSDLTFIEPSVVKLDYGRCLQSNRAVSILLCSIWDCRSWFEISIYESEWIYMKFRTLCVQCEALFGFMTRSECFQKHSLCSWVGMLWLHRFRKLFDLLEVYESDWDVLLDHPSRFLTWLRTSEMLMKPVLLPLASIWDTLALWGQCLRILFEVLRHCEDNAYVPYLRYSGIVRTMPTYLPWPLDVWSGKLHYDLYACDLLLTFGYDSERTTLALWLFMTGYWLRSRAEHSTLLDGLELWEDISVRRTVLEMEHEVPCCSVLQEDFV